MPRSPETSAALAAKSEAELRRLMWQAAAKRGDALWVVPLLVALVAAAATLVVGWQVMRIVSAAISGSATNAAAAGTAPGATAASSLPEPLRITLILITLAAFGFTWIICRRYMVMRTMRRLLNKVSCPFCEFSIVGLRADGAFVTCPECGQRFDLYEHGLKPADLVSDAEKRRPFKGAGRFGAYRTPTVKSK